jgi:hypothetical protein
MLRDRVWDGFWVFSLGSGFGLKGSGSQSEVSGLEEVNLRIDWRVWADTGGSYLADSGRSTQFGVNY